LNFILNFVNDFLPLIFLVCFGEKVSSAREFINETNAICAKRNENSDGDFLRFFRKLYILELKIFIKKIRESFLVRRNLKRKFRREFSKRENLSEKNSLSVPLKYP
jgi:hypothetical protein